MTIRNTQKKGFTLSTQEAEIRFNDPVEIVRKSNEGEPLEIRDPGEYEIEGVSVFADYIKKNDQGTTGYLIHVDNLIVGYIPFPAGEVPNIILPEYEQINILITSGSNAELVNQIAPPVVIPIDDVKKLCEALGTEVPEESSTFTAKAVDALPEETEVVYLG